MIDIHSIKMQIGPIVGIEDIDIYEKNSVIVAKFKFNANVAVQDAIYLLDYAVQLNIPKRYPEILPTVFETGEKKVQNFPHINPDDDGTFCLGTDMDMRRQLHPDYSIREYINMIASFLGTYEFYKRYHVFPFGDRNHGDLGILETYKELFEVATNSETLRLMQLTSIKNKHRNKKCPCGSNLKFKKCHWNEIQSILGNSLKKLQMKKDFKILRSMYGRTSR